MNVENMEGGLLDLWVALAIGYRRSPDDPEANPNTGNYWLRMGRSSSVFACPRFSFAPRDVMAVIERFKPELIFHARIGEWAASCSDSEEMLCSGFGKTVGEAVARAVVLARFGEDPQLDTDDEPTDYDACLHGAMV